MRRVLIIGCWMFVFRGAAAMYSGLWRWPRGRFDRRHGLRVRWRALSRQFAINRS
jgi:hypothetical protein